MINAEPFTADYYERGEELGLSCYTNYRWLPHLTVPMASRIVQHLRVEKEETLLDFGCAKGFLVKALRTLGYNAFGVDISTYAIMSADDATAPYLSLISGIIEYAAFDWVLAKDVLEHVPEECLVELLTKLHARKMFAAMPLGDGREYVIGRMEDDVTHIIRRPLEWWVEQFRAAGFRDVWASYSMAGVKERWTKAFSVGNGFIIAE
jgi:SAM-dependent methyltransferase